MSKKADERAAVEALVNSLFALVETHQGYFHVSDGETFATRAEFFGRVRGRLAHGRAAVSEMESFLRKHGENPT